MDAVTRMQKAAQAHRDDNPGHVVEENTGTDWKGAYATWRCVTCVEKKA